MALPLDIRPSQQGQGLESSKGDTTVQTDILFASKERKPLIPLTKSIIPACDVEDLGSLRKLVRETAGLEGVGAYKLGMTTFFEEGLKKAVEVVREETEKLGVYRPVIVDYQKAGNDIPEMGVKFARAIKKAGADAAILFPFTGPATQEAWTTALQEQEVTVIVGGHMTHKNFLRSEGGYIADDTPERIYKLAAENGVRDFVVPGNKPEFVEKYRALMEGIFGEGNFTLYAPGFVTQGGDVSETGKVAGENFHAIVGSGIYEKPNMKKAAKFLADKIMALQGHKEQEQGAEKMTAKEKFIHMLGTTLVLGKARRRTGEPGNRQFIEESRPMAMLDFPEREGEFALKTHVEDDPEQDLSPYFLNIGRNCPEEVLTQAALAIKEMGPFDGIDFLVGVPDAGVQIAKAVSEMTGVPLRQVIKKDESGKKIIADELAEESSGNVCLIEDLFTTGGSTLRAAKPVESLGYKVIEARATVDREQGGVNFLKKNNIRGRAAITVTEAFDQLREELGVDGKAILNVEKYEITSSYVAKNRPRETVVFDGSLEFNGEGIA